MALVDLEISRRGGFTATAARAVAAGVLRGSADAGGGEGGRGYRGGQGGGGGGGGGWGRWRWGVVVESVGGRIRVRGGGAAEDSSPRPVADAAKVLLFDDLV